MNVCKNLLLGDPDLEYALFVCADKFSINIDYKDTDSLSVFIAGDGAATALIRKCEPRNRILGYASISDGSLVDFEASFWRYEDSTGLISMQS